jgi:hypothetical protein
MPAARAALTAGLALRMLSTGDGPRAGATRLLADDDVLELNRFSFHFKHPLPQ